MNEYGLDTGYFAAKLKSTLQDVSRYTPSEMARELARMSVTADKSGLGEDEFAQSGWISVKERTPEVGEECLILIPVINHSNIENGKYKGCGVWSGAWCSDRGYECTYKVTHWMPRPKLPEAD